MGQAKLKELRSDLFDKIKGCLDQQFEGKEEEVAVIIAAKVLDSQDWADVYDEDMRMGDRKSLLLIHTKFQDVLSDVDIDECYKELPQIKQFVRRNYGHLAKRQHCVCTKFLNKQGNTLSKLQPTYQNHISNPFILECHWTWILHNKIAAD